MESSSRRARSVWFPRVREVALQDEPLPQVGEGDVRVQAIASAISQGTEMLVYRGQVPPGMSLDLPTLEGSFSFPIKYGYASVGRIQEVGPGVRKPEVGNAVFVHHPHQSEYVVPASMAIRLPEGLDPTLGVFLANVETAVNVMLDTAPRLGERVVVFGQGVVGLLLTQLLRRAGAGKVIAVEPAPARRVLAETLGAEVVLMPGEELTEEVRALTDGMGADIALEASGNGTALAQALDCVAFQGTIVVCSWYGTKDVSLPLGGRFHRERLRLVSSQVGTVDPALQPRWSRERRMAVALDLLSSLTLEPLISHRFPVEQAAEAYDLVDRHPEETGQVILTYG